MNGAAAVFQFKCSSYSTTKQISYSNLLTALPWGASHSLLEGGKHSLVKGMSGKGGHRNFVKSYIDPGILFDTLSRHDDLLPQFGAYDHVSRNQSIDPKGLLQVLPLVKSLIKASPSCEIHSNPLRGALLQLVCSKPNLNTSKWNGTVWSNLRCERIGVVLHHMRRLKNSPEEVRKAAGKLTGAEIAELQNVVDSIVIAGEEPKRKLKKETSEVSLGSDGYPTEFKTPEQKGKGEGEKQPLLKGKNSAKKRSGQEALLKGQSACSAAASSPPSFLRRRKGAMATNPPEEEQEHSEQFAEAMGFKKPKGQKKEKKLKMPASAKVKGMKRPACALAKSDKRPWVKLSITYARKPQRAYIMGSKEEKAKPKLVVEVSSVRSASYKEIIQKIYKKIKAENLSKQEALKLRGELCWHSSFNPCWKDSAFDIFEKLLQGKEKERDPLLKGGTAEKSCKFRNCSPPGTMGTSVQRAWKRLPMDLCKSLFKGFALQC